MNCSNCQLNSYKKSGKTKLGYQRYLCKACSKTWSDSPYVGRPTVKDSPMSDAERAKRYRKKNQFSPSTSS